MKQPTRVKLHEKALWGGYERSGQPAAVHDCYYQCASNNSDVPQLWAYMDKLSYAPGSRAKLHVSTTAGTFGMVIFRDGGLCEKVFSKQDITGGFYKTPSDCSVNGCDWPHAIEIEIGSEWASGGYILELTASNNEILKYQHVFLVRPGSANKEGRLLLVTASGTWTAYNDWGGSNHYEGICGETGDQFSPILSIHRPYASGFVDLPDEAPRIPLKQKSGMGDSIKYPHMEWAYANGYSKKYASAGWASYERPYVQWLENTGYKVDLISEQDLHYRPKLLDGYSCISIIGHSEYWSWEMRDAVDQYVENGGNVARFAGNFFWQIRLENEGATQVCYKYIARQNDPLRYTENSQLTTICWDAPETGRPAAETFGLSGSRGMYTGWGGCCPRGAGGFTVYRPEHWIFEAADLYYGDVLGAESQIFGYEVDGLDYLIKDGLPFATGSDGSPANLLILAMGLSTVFEADYDNGTMLFIGSTDAEFMAEAIHGEVTPALVDRYKRGSGMIAIFERGDGCVVNAGSCEWVAGLIDHDPQVELVTRNILNRFIGLGVE